LGFFFNKFLGFLQVPTFLYEDRGARDFGCTIDELIQ